ncbi:tetratricopeptide repeat protein [Novosphingobium sp. TH158]|uniref:tetratricopeptide repeat protein n=1 Tax=Novosphingobium sp. TH158 TaxID=2067455 RepID=UPI000C7C5679|nr:tetratricopeptide repeat protein [Novosphingobium sp. TH158]PLK27130.1 hypothetical protein C0V78_09715 [Novosphingobium sp. TH158]
MTLIASILLIAQFGPFTGPNAQPGPRIPPPAVEGRDVKKPAPAPAAAPPARKPAVETCFLLAQSDPAEALVAANDALAGKSGKDLADAQLCKAFALAGLERWGEAEAGFLAARDQLEENDHAARAELDAGAGIAAEGQLEFARAVEHFARAFDHAVKSADMPLVGRVARDRANSLFKLGRKAEALASLNEARNRLPADPVTWTISARAARIEKRLDEAQAFIQTAARLDPRDPAIGLEAGVIAMLSGREQAARRSWQSVVATAPDSPEARQAKAYLDQIGPAADTAARPAAKPAAQPAGTP